MTANAVSTTKQKALAHAKYIDGKKAGLEGLLPKGVEIERVAKLTLQAIMNSPQLLQCSPESVWFAAGQAAGLWLEVGVMGYAYLVPYRDKCQLIVSYKGMIELCMRTGLIEDITARAAYKGDEFDVDFGANKITHRINVYAGSRDPKDYIGVYAIAKYKSGVIKFDYMSKAEINAIRTRSPASGRGPWVTDEVEMAKKTVIKRLCKTLPQSVELAAVYDAEDGKPILQSTGRGGDFASLVSDIESGRVEVTDVEYASAPEEETPDVPATPKAERVMAKVEKQNPHATAKKETPQPPPQPEQPPLMVAGL